MIGREEICSALSYLIQTIRGCVDPKQKIAIDGEVILAGSVLQHSEILLKKLTQETQKIGDGGQIMMTQNAYKELMKKIEEAERVTAGSAKAVVVS